MSAHFEGKKWGVSAFDLLFFFGVAHKQFGTQALTPGSSTMTFATVLVMAVFVASPGALAFVSGSTRSGARTAGGQGTIVVPVGEWALGKGGYR